MKSLTYLWKTIFKNRIKIALRKPASYVIGVFIVFYFAIILFSVAVMSKDMKLPPESIASILSFFAVMYMPLNLATYAKRKGIVFTKADVNILFTAPINPKLVMLFSKLRTVKADIMISFFVFLAGIFVLHIALWKMLVYFLFTVIIKQILETSLVLILYTSESVSEKQRNLLSYAIYALLIVFALSIVIYVRAHDMKVFSVVNIFDHTLFKMIPLIGWNCAFIFLLFSKVTMVNIVGSLLYGATALFLLIFAVKMKCSGEYYEEAMQFADDYEKAREKSKKGEVAVIGKKQKYLNKTIQYKGTNAKAIFYRQLLEYKKNRFFIFGFTSLLYLLVGIGIGAAAKYSPELAELGVLKNFVLPLIIAYFSLIFSGYRTKWSKELENPWTFLIPDGSVKKLWYATLVEHIRGLCNGVFITVPAAIGLQLEPSAIIAAILTCALMNAGKVYGETLIRFITGNCMGNFITGLISIFLEGIHITVGALAALAGCFFSQTIGMAAMIFALFIVVLILMVISSTLFERMESTL